jgi:hypothetical protein
MEIYLPNSIFIPRTKNYLAAAFIPPHGAPT